MFGCQAQRRGVGAQQAGVGQQLDAGILRGGNDGGVLRGALTDLAGRDEQQLVHALEGRFERDGLGVVGLPDLHPQDGEVGGFFRAAHGGHDLGGGNRVEQLPDDEAAELAGGAGDGNHENPLVVMNTGAENTDEANFLQVHT